MAEVELGPQLKPTDKVGFIDSHRPALDDGTYTATVEHRLVIDGHEELKATRSLTFVVAGPRFGLGPGEVASSFPPPGSHGAFGSVLPHVLLRRASLPWERSAAAGSRGDGPPWLALLVLAEDEFTHGTVAASTLITGTSPAQAGGPFFQALPAGPGDDADRPVSVIDLDASLAQSLLPGGDDLRWLAGVREVNDADARALVVANRLPVEGKRNVVHLVSVEHQYRLVAPPPAQPHYERVPPPPPPPGASDKVRLVSLAQWDFHCDAGAKADLRTLLQHLSIGALRLPSSSLGAARGPAEVGAVPLEHRLAGGQRSAAWYHGPLMTHANGAAITLPARRADDLLLVEKATGMTDVSYAAAWTLGRLLALRDPAVGVPLHQWKRQVAHAAHSAAGAVAARGAAPPAPPSPPPSTLKPWFENALARLATVPFAYLVPEPALLPSETLCLFALDPRWIAALCDGAFSMGRTSERERKADEQRQAEVLPSFGGRSGMLLRSAAVAGWPDLVVDGFSAKRDALQPLRFARLAADTLLVLFDGVVASVDLHSHPQALHFGFDGTARSALAKGGVALPWRGDPGLGVIDIATLAAALGAGAPHDFALRMLESAPKVSYQVQVPDV